MLHEALSDCSVELSLLHCLICDPSKIELASTRLSPSQGFVSPGHQQLYSEILSLHGRGIIPDQAMLGKFLEPAEWDRLNALNVNPERTEQYVNRLVELSSSRALRTLGQRISLIAESDDPTVAYHEAVTAVAQFGQHHLRSQRVVALQDHAHSVVEQYRSRLERHERGETFDDSVPTGITVTYENGSIATLDEFLLLEPGSLTIYAARPSVGKTVALGMTALAASAAVAQRYPTLFCSLETTGQKLAMRLMAAVGHINSVYFRSNAPPDRSGLVAMEQACELLADRPLYTLTGKQTMVELATQARLAHAQHGIRLICVDYLQLVDHEFRRSQQNLAEAIHHTAYGLQTLAKELNLPIVAACQLNRESEGGEVPDLRHLQGSSGIEQAADNIVLLWVKDKQQADIVSGIISKNRDGQASVEFTMRRQPWMAFDPYQGPEARR